MRREMAGKRVILTGATGGIGRAMAAALVRGGARVAISGRKGEALEALAAELRKDGGTALAVVADVTVPEDRVYLVETAAKSFGGIDILINNAGVGSWGHFAGSSEGIVRKVMEVNFFGPVELTRLAIPHLIDGVDPCVVNVASMCGRRGMPAWSEYSASKFALVGMSEAWRGEFERFGVDVLTIVPGKTQSGFQNNWLRADGRADLGFDTGMTTDRLAAGIATAIRKNRTETVLGGEARRLLWFNRYLPKLTAWGIARAVTKLYRTPRK